MPLTAKSEEVIIQLLQESLNSSSDVPSALDQFSRLLQLDKTIPTDVGILLSNSVNEYCDLIRNREYLGALRNTFNSVYDILSGKEVSHDNNTNKDEITGNNESKYQTNGILNFKIEGRRKGVINSIEKMLRLLREERSLDLFRDSMGIRVILFGDESESLQKETYNIMEKIIQFMLYEHFTLCEADHIKQIKLDEGVNILIPETSSISPLYKTGVKDYIRFPKKNGYQSLHTIFRARNSSFIEIQVRTEQMHLHAEYNDANHSLYKTDKYGDRLHSKIDFSKIHMPGFRYLSDGTIYDDIGLQTSLLTFYRTKSF